MLISITPLSDFITLLMSGNLETLKFRIAKIYCENSICPEEVLTPSEDCTLNVSSPFTMQVYYRFSVFHFLVMIETEFHLLQYDVNYYSD